LIEKAIVLRQQLWLAMDTATKKSGKRKKKKQHRDSRNSHKHTPTMTTTTISSWPQLSACQKTYFTQGESIPN
jgi:hypothetical protein